MSKKIAFKYVKISGAAIAGVGVFLFLASAVVQAVEPIGLNNILLLASEKLVVGDKSIVHSGHVVNNAPDSNPNRHETRVRKICKNLT